MFCYKLDEALELRLLEPRHAEELFLLTDQSGNILVNGFRGLISRQRLLIQNILSI